MDGPVLTFLGATGTVTGSRFLLETPDARVLVDCGMFQGLKHLRERNRAPFPVDPAGIDCVLLTHAHVDHCGYLPVLTRGGFTGPVHATESTVALAGIVLPDSGHLQEEEAAFANRMGFSKHRPAEPLYTEADAYMTLDRLRSVPFENAVELAPGVRATFRRAGHILGSASISVEVEGRVVCFSGDLGRSEHPLLLPPAPAAAADTVVVESTYGDREHDDVGALDRMSEAITRTVRRGGTVVVPAFAVDRTEVVLHHLARLLEQGAIPEVPVYVDSPMALSAMRVYLDAMRRSDGDLRPDLVPADLDPGNVIEVRDPEESRAIDGLATPSIVVSASGMATGGRVLHHLARRLPDHRNSVLLVGYQAEGTRGRRLLNGERTLKMLGRYVPVRADVVDVTGLSVHADRSELLDWVATADSALDTVLVVHGEEDASRSLAVAVTERLDVPAAVPGYRERVRLA